MNNFPVEGLLWFLASLLPLILVQRWLSQELQLVFLILTRKQSAALGAYSLLLFPGVLIHELSHLIVAKLLFVRTGRVNLIPKLLPDGMLRMGYVEVEKTDFIRGTLIGTAPIITGAVSISYLWTGRLGLSPLLGFLLDGKFGKALEGLKLLTGNPYWWVWFYITLAVSITMLPSRSDRRSWVAFGLVVAALIAVGVFSGMGGWMTETLAPWFNERLFDFARVVGVSVCLQAVIATVLSILRYLLARLFGYPSVY